MGKGIKAKPKTARYSFSKSEFNDVKHELVKKVMLLAAITYADEALFDEENNEYAFDADEKILAYWDRISRYSEAVDDKLITMHFVTKVLREKVKLDVHW